MEKVVLAINVGNTFTQFGIFTNGSLKKKFRIPTNQFKNFQLTKKLLQTYTVTKVTIASVVPTVLKQLVKILIFKKIPYIIANYKLNLDMPIKYGNPALLGADRLVNAYAGGKIYGFPAIVVDTGTAITIDVVSPKGEFIGGIIMPGLQTMANALHNQTAQLPLVNLNNFKSASFIGKNTKECIKIGVAYGTIGAVKYIVDNIKKRLGEKAVVIATGGAIKFFANKTRIFDKIDYNLTLKGLYFITRRRK